MRLILVGAPGAGKGTQAELVGKILKIPSISTGNIIRDAMKNLTPLGLQTKSYVESGKLVPDSIIVNMLQERLMLDDCQNGYILDGFPRNIQQALSLADMDIHIDRVIYLSVDDTSILQRLGGRRVCQECGCSYHIDNKRPIQENVCDECGGMLSIRKDDAPDTIRERLKVYHEMTEPLIEYYSQKGMLSVINGDDHVEKITQNIIHSLKPAIHQ